MSILWELGILNGCQQVLRKMPKAVLTSGLQAVNLGTFTIIKITHVCR